MNEETFRVELLTGFNEAGVLNEFDKLMKKVDTAAADKLKKSMRDVQSNLKTSGGGSALSSMGGGDNGGSGGIKGFFREAGRSLRGLLVIGGKVTAMLGIAAGFFKIMEPIFKMLGSITDMISMFLRPISDIMLTLVSPIMMMLRPLVQVFNSLMMPFRQIAMEGLASSNKLIGQGMNEIATGDEEVGRGLMAEGMKGALSSSKLLLSGFIDIVFDPFKNIDFMGIGQAIDNGIQKMESDAIEGIIRVQNFDKTFEKFNDTFKMNGSVFDDVTQSVNNQMSLVTDKFDEFNIDNYKDALSDAEVAFDAAAGILDGDDNSLTKAAETFGIKVEDVMADLTHALNDEDVKKNVDSFWNTFFSEGEKIAGAKRQVERLGEDIESSEPGRFARVGQGFESVKDNFNIKNILNPSGISFDFVEGFSKDPMKEWRKNNQDEVDSLIEYWDGNLPSGILKGLMHSNEHVKEYLGESIIPDGFKAGLEHMFKHTTAYLGPEEGKITQRFNTGMTTMDASTNTFGTTLSKVSGLLDDATSRMEKYASSYRSAVRRIERLERSLSNSRSVVR